jgi:hypothetical protein
MASKLSITIVIFVAVTVAVIVVAAVLSSQPPSEAIVAGVVPGNTFTYELKSYTAVSEENVTIPPAVSEYNRTESYRVSITAVSGPEVSFNTTWRFINGTENENAFKINLLTGINNPPFWAMYQSNLSLNSVVHPSGSDGLIVNQTEIRSYKAGDRVANIITLQNQFVDASNPTRTYDDYLYVHFDKITGMLVELKEIQVYNDPQVVLTYEWRLVDSNVWAVS